MSLPRGFTLIELLVVISIVGLLFGVSIVGYINFASRQELENAYQELSTNLVLARQFALSGEKPVDCTGTLHRYKVNFLSTTSYRIEAICSTGRVGSLLQIPVRTFNLTTGVVFDPIPSSFSFLSLGRGTDISDSVPLTLKQTTTNRTINATVDKAGNLKRIQ